MACATEDIKINLGLNNCDIPLARGVDETIFFGRFAWLATNTADATNKKIIRTMTLATGKKLLRYIGKNFSNQVSSAISVTDNGPVVAQNLTFVIFTKSPEEEAEIDALLRLKDVFVIVLLNGNPSSFKILGWKTGMRVIGGGNDHNDEALKGAYTIQLSAPEEQTTVYTFQHMTTGGTPVDDTATYLDALALAIA